MPLPGRSSLSAIALLILLALPLVACSDDNGASSGPIPSTGSCIDYADYARVLGIVKLPATPFAVAAAGNVVCVADGEAGVQVVDVTSDAHPIIIGNVD